MRDAVYDAPWTAMALAQGAGDIWPSYVLTHGIWWPCSGRQSGDGCSGDGDAYGDGDGDGEGFGFGDGDGFGAGSGSGDGAAYGAGDGDGDGFGAGDGDGEGDGFGDGRPWQRQTILAAADMMVEIHEETR